MRVLVARLSGFLTHHAVRIGRRMKRPHFAFGLIALVVVGFVLTTEPAFAQNEPDVFDYIMLWLAQLIMNLASIIGQLVVVLLDILIIPLMQYNGFSTAAVISTGWAIVRDVVNMFFVVVLIAIAFGTIFGSQRFQWQQQVTRLLIFAIVINFSRTIAGLMIDVGQVVMLTFANALKDIAGGNFIQLFGLNSILELSDKAEAIVSAASDPNAPGLGAFDFLAAAVAGLVMISIVLAVMVMLTAILAYRIVMLWVLVVVAPLAFFLGGIKGVSPQAGDGYGRWWKRFTCMVVIGPVLTFFVWLALVVAGAGNIATSEGFVQGAATTSPLGDANVTGNILQALETSRMTSFIIGIALIFAGFEAASEFCQSSGFVSGALQRGKGAATRIARAPIALGAAGAGGAAVLGLRGGRRIGGFAGREGLGLLARSRVGQAVGRARGAAVQTARESIAKVPGVGQFAAEAISKREQVGAARKAARIGEEMEGLKGVERSVIADRVQSLASQKGPLREADIGRVMTALKNKKSRGELEQTGALEDLLKNHGDQIEEFVGGDKELDDVFSEVKKQNVHASGDTSKIQNWDDVKELSPSAIASMRGDEKFKSQLEGISVGKDESGNDINAYQKLMSGEGLKKDQADAAKHGQAAVIGKASAATLDKMPIERLNASFDGTNVEVMSNEVAERMLTGGNGDTAAKLKSDDALYQAVMKKGAGIDVAAGTVTDADKFGKMVKSSPNVAGMLKPSDVAGEIGQVAGRNLDPSSLKSFVNDYKKATPEQRAGMSDMVSSFEAAHGAALEAAPDGSDEAANIAASMDYLSTQLGAVANREAQSVAREINVNLATEDELPGVIEDLESRRSVAEGQQVQAQTAYEIAEDENQANPGTHSFRAMEQLEERISSATENLENIDSQLTDARDRLASAASELNAPTGEVLPPDEDSGPTVAGGGGTPGGGTTT